MEKYRRNKVDKNKKRLKGIVIMFLTIALILELNTLDTRLKKSTNTQTSIYSLSLNKKTLDLELFGNEHSLSNSEIKNILKNLKIRVKS